MIRTKEPQTQLFYGAEEICRSPRNAFYQRLNAVVGCWKDLCTPLQASFSTKNTGCPVDPVVYFKIFLIGYLEGIVWDTDLAERVADSLSIREFVGYALSERTPDHASLSRVRAAFAQDSRLTEVLEKTVTLCANAGLIAGNEAAVDSTLIRANASLSSLKSVKTGMSVGKHLELCKQNKVPPKIDNEEFVSTSDPGAQIAMKGAHAPRGMYYKTTLVVDAQSQVILAESTCHASDGEGEAARAPLKQAKARLKANDLELSTVVADTGYDDSEFHAFVESLEAKPVTNYKTNPPSKDGRFGIQDFTYDSENDQYTCPNGKALINGGKCKSDGRIIYSSKRTDCKGCPLAQRCLGKDLKRRTLHRTPNQAARERNIERCHTSESRAALKRRKTAVEPPFAHMKRLGGLNYINCRGLGKAEVKTGMAAIAWNLLKLTKNLTEEALERLNRQLFGYLSHYHGIKFAMITAS